MSLIETGIAVDQENYQAENDLTIDTGYFGDVETSSGNLSLQSKSDSDDNSSEISFEGINNITPHMIKLISNVIKFCCCCCCIVCLFSVMATQ